MRSVRSDADRPAVRLDGKREYPTYEVLKKSN